MYENRRLKFFPSQPEVDIYQIIREAQSRWLRPVEVIEILRNYQKFRLNPVPPNKPPSGSLFLFDRKTLRFFRKDGHNWRKKKDGKTVREAHERLKAGSVDVLHCYYAHGEDNPNFQRRSYWMLEGAYEHIVLVHYREVTEGSRSSIYRSIQEASTNKDNVTQATNLGRPTTLGVPVCANSPGISETEVTGPYKSPEASGTLVESEETDSADEGDNDDNPSTALVENQHTSLLQQVSGSGSSRTSMHHGPPFDHNLSSLTCVQAKQDVGLEQLQAGSLTANQPVNQGPSGTGKDLNNVDFEDLLKNPDAYLGQNSISSAVTLDVLGWNALLETFRGTGPIESTAKSREQQNTSLGQGYRPPQSSLNTVSSDRSNNTFNGLPLNRIPTPNAQNLTTVGQMQCLKPPEVQHMEVDVRHLCVQQQKAEFNSSVEYQNLQHGRHDENLKSTEESNALKKLDSFGRWMSREIGEDSQSSLLSGSTDHGAYWTLEDHSTLDEISSFSHQMQLDVGLSPSLSQNQQFSIVDFSPDWAFSSEETKVIVAGNFLKEGTNTTWYCMFGEVEVPAELIHEGVLRCKAPPHAPGRVPLYITPGNRLACSEVREFEYRAAASDSLERAAGSSTSSQLQDEFLQMRFARLISLSSEERAAKSDLIDKVQPAKIQGLTLNLEKQWEDIETRTRESGPDTKEWVLETLLRQQLQKWLMSRVSEDGKGASVLDTHGQGVLHLAAALGYDWAIPATLASGVGINFRDIHGWTALHWAAYHGREKVVSTLLAAGASPGLVTDPTPQYPSGRTPADLAASSGHKGMAGYLAEMSLTSHLTSLTLKERSTNEIDSYSAVLAEEKAVELISEKGGIDQTVKGPDEHSMFQDSLRAVRNAARAAALIHASFRQESFKRRQEKLGTEVVDGYGMSLEEVKTLASLHAERGHRKEPLHSAATKIQQKFRGWKGRRDFLLLRQRVVRIQAHVRGHQVRRKFRKFLWSVGILDKVVLRWRRKRTGLRNFHASVANKETENSDDDEVLKVGRKQKEAAMQKAVTRVQSMVRSHQAREQYQRIQEAYLQAVAGDRAGVENEDESMFASGD